MTGSSTEQASHVFGCLHGMVRTAALYPPMHGQTVKAKQTLHEALTTYLSAHGRLVYGFVGDVLVADNRILPRESLSTGASSRSARTSGISGASPSSRVWS